MKAVWVKLYDFDDGRRSRSVVKMRARASKTALSKSIGSESFESAELLCNRL